MKRVGAEFDICYFTLEIGNCNLIPSTCLQNQKVLQQRDFEFELFLIKTISVFKRFSITCLSLFDQKRNSMTFSFFTARCIQKNEGKSASGLIPFREKNVLHSISICDSIDNLWKIEIEHCYQLAHGDGNICIYFRLIVSLYQLQTSIQMSLNKQNPSIHLYNCFCDVCFDKSHNSSCP